MPRLPSVTRRRGRCRCRCRCRCEWPLPLDVPSASGLGTSTCAAAASAAPASPRRRRRRPSAAARRSKPAPRPATSRSLRSRRRRLRRSRREPRSSGCTGRRSVADAVDQSPSVARSSAGRNREPEPAEDVVDDRLGDSGSPGCSVKPDGSKRTWAELVDQRLQRHAVLERVARSRARRRPSGREIVEPSLAIRGRSRPAGRPR